MESPGVRIEEEISAPRKAAELEEEREERRAAEDTGGSPTRTFGSASPMADCVRVNRL